MTPMIARLFALLALTLSAPALADPLPPLAVDHHGAWQAIGRVNVAGFNRRGMCSGTLIDANTVLTAAHCVLKPNLRPHRIADMTFVAGWLRGAYAGFAKPTSVTLHPKALEDGMLHPAFDLALLHLDAPLTIPPLPVSRADPTQPFAMVGYYDLRPHMLSARFDCDGRTTPQGLILGCQTRPGNSGGPILARTDGKWQVVGVVSAGNAQITIAALLGDFVTP